MSFQKKGGKVTPKEVAADALVGMNLFFKLQGDIDNYKVSYDAKASRKSLTKAFKAQGKTLKALVQGEYQGQKYFQELALDNYFEFDE